MKTKINAERRYPIDFTNFLPDLKVQQLVNYTDKIRILTGAKTLDID